MKLGQDFPKEAIPLIISYTLAVACLGQWRWRDGVHICSCGIHTRSRSVCAHSHSVC